jgi:two-component system cell cycle response regulator
MIIDNLLKQSRAGQKLKLKPAKKGSPSQASGENWRVLVVDDEFDVHDMTKVLLRGQNFEGHGFEVVSAYSAAQAREILRNDPEIPVILLDVVMETPDAGLKLVRSIREEMGNHHIRILLRTGQPGEAPERKVVAEFDINDYRNKSELTSGRLFTSLAGALRSWIDIRQIERLKSTFEERVEQRTRELDEARRFSEHLVEMMPNPVWFKDERGHYRFYNKAFREFFSIGSDCWKGQDTGDFIEGEFALADAATDKDILSSRLERAEYEIAFAAASGVVRTLMVAKSALHSDKGQPCGVVGVITDISDRKVMETELRRRATIDPLTELVNRRHFWDLARTEIERTRRFGHPLSLIMLDIDHFKRVNDSFGHGTGDRVLACVASACRSVLREVDVLGRLGGEEFAVLLPETPLESALDVAQRLRQAVMDLRLDGQCPGLASQTISLGVAERQAEEGFDTLLLRADKGLYKAKRGGRNQVAVWDPLDWEGDSAAGGGPDFLASGI